MPSLKKNPRAFGAVCTEGPDGCRRPTCPRAYRTFFVDEVHLSFTFACWPARSYGQN